MALTFGSLFAGIGGMDLGLERAGMVCRWQVEIDPYCQRVLAKHWPNVPKYGDIREVTGEGLEPVDLICGGFPCQDISIAGKQAGIDGARSGLWGEYVRLIRVVRPRFVLVENVPNLLALGMGRVLGDLAESGYDAEWDCLPAAAVGAPHLRDRLFVVAYPSGTGTGDQSGATGGQGWQPADALQPTALRPRDRQASAARTHSNGADVADTQSPRLAFASGRSGTGTRLAGSERGGVPIGGFAANWATEPAVGRVVDGVSNRVHRLRGLGNAVVPQVAEFIGRRIVEVAA